MKTALLDSSVWISFFAQDSNKQKANRLIQVLIKNNTYFIIPNIIYMEVLNTLLKLQLKEKIKEIKALFLSTKSFKLIHMNKTFHEKLEKYAGKTRLKTLDLIILTFSFESKIDEFYSFDQKLINGYNHVKKSL